MFSSGAQYNKLKTNLRLSINRLKLLEKKKTELAQKSRKEIADYIASHKEDRARIRVEHIIREDYLVEAYELLEMYCDLLLARFGLVSQMKSLDEGLEECVNSLLWAAPRVQAEIPEFKIISDQLALKYGKPFAEAARSDQLGKVNAKLMAKMSASAPPKILVEKYMLEIAKAAGVPFAPDPSVMREDEVAAAEAMLIDFHNQVFYSFHSFFLILFISLIFSLSRFIFLNCQFRTVSSSVTHFYLCANKHDKTSDDCRASEGSDGCIPAPTLKINRRHPSRR